MTTYVFLGPTLTLAKARRMLDVVYLPPVRQGDLYRLTELRRPSRVALIDGYFSQVPAVWHKEILWALHRGVRVYGAASMGALLLAGGAAGKRSCLPHSRIMIHQPLGGFQGQATDIDIHAREILHARDQLNRILAHHTGQPIERIADDTERDRFMGGDDAVEYGLIDKVLDARAAAAE